MKVVYTAGVWDILHVGHLNLTKRAKLCGDYLVVGVCADHLVNKNLVNDQYNRAEVISSLKWVDEVFIYNTLLQTDQLQLFNASVFVIGEDFGHQGIPEHQQAIDYCISNRIELARIKRMPAISTSIIKDKVNECKRFLEPTSQQTDG